jgi:4'-phosphopantetheinyl transferase
VVDVHCFSLDVDAARLRELDGFLSWEERERATRFRFDRDRDRYIACRGTLRELLGVRPHENFICGAFGKPRLQDSEMWFNVSHSHGMAMIAVTRGREVGCDIERIDPSFANDKIPERFFSPYEVAALRALPQKDQCDAFFRCWTRKEAFIKACGMGMSLALDSFDVSLDRPALLRGAEGWSLYAVDAPEGYAAALVLEDQPGITMPTSSLISSITKSGGAAANVSG